MHANDVGFHATLSGVPVTIVVAGNKFEGRKLHRRRQRFNAIVEVVIAQRNRTSLANQRHRLIFNLAFVKIEVGRALKHITRIDQQRVGVSFAGCV